MYYEEKEFSCLKFCCPGMTHRSFISKVVNAVMLLSDTRVTKEEEEEEY